MILYRIVKKLNNLGNIENSLKAYKEALMLAQENLEVVNPVRLGLLLNYSVFCFEILKMPAKAREICQEVRLFATKIIRL